MTVRSDLMHPDEASQLQGKEQRLLQLLTLARRPLICLSGGVDSSYLLSAAQRIHGEDVEAFTADSPSLPRRQLVEARRVASRLGVRLHVFDAGEHSDPNYRKNPHNRCYFCKKALFIRAKTLATSRKLESILVGTNADDLEQHRPGLQAAEEYRVQHPLAEAGLTKHDVRQLAKVAGLPNWNAAEAPCLASRLPTGLAVTPARLRQIEVLEETLTTLGFKGHRVRHHDTVARIELPENEIERAAGEPVRKRLLAAGQQAGFAFVAVDLRGYRRGSLSDLNP